MTPNQSDRAARKARKTARKRADREAFVRARDAHQSGTAHGRLSAAGYLATRPHRRRAVEAAPIVPDWTDEEWDDWVSSFDPIPHAVLQGA